MERRVVITGLGAITPIGNTSKEMWESIKDGKCGIGELTLINSETFKTKLAAEVKSYDPHKYFEVKAAKR